MLYMLVSIRLRHFEGWCSIKMSVYFFDNITSLNSKYSKAFENNGTKDGPSVPPTQGT